MSVLIASDLHAHTWTRFSKMLPTGVNSRFQDLLNVLDQIEWCLDEYHPSTLILLGDLTHLRYFVRYSVLNPLAAKLAHLRTKVKDLIIIPGNHDIEAEGVHSLSIFQHMDITVLDTPSWRHVDGLGWVYFVPYMHYGVAEAMDQPPPMGARGLPAGAMLHYALDGKVLDSEYRLPSPLTLAHTHEFDRLWLGHVHSPGIENNGATVYVGAPMHFDFGDVGDRFAWLVDHETSQPIKLTAPKFITAAYPRVAEPESPNDFLRVLGVPRAMLQDVRQSALDLGWADAVCVEASVPTEAVKLITSGSFVNDELVREYVAAQFAGLTEEAREPIIAAGLEYLRKAEGE